MAKKEKIVKKNESKNVEAVITVDDSLELGLENSELLEANVGTFEEEIMNVSNEIAVEEVKEEVQEVGGEVKEEEVKEEVIPIEQATEINNPNVFKRMFGYIWNGQVCGE